MSDLVGVLRAAGDELDALGRAWALLGGLAVSARSEPRFTRDVDLAVSVEGDAQAEELVRALVSRGYRIIASVEQEATGRLATVRLIGPGESEHGVVVDLLFASSGIEPEIVAAADRLDVVAGMTVPVARLGHLLATKLLSRDERRPQDQVDLVALMATAGSPDLAEAREALALITSRGYSRGRDLASALSELIREHGAPEA